MKDYKLIGLTGQTGAGKSTVSRLFREKGVYVIDADMLVRELYTPDSLCLRLIASEFGAEVLCEDKSLNRAVLREYAFRDSESTQRLNSIVHPLVTDLFIKRLSEVARTHSLIVYDAPQLFESGCDVLCDCVLSVMADRAVRLKRICDRDKITPQQAESRMNAQLSESFFEENSDFILRNDTDINTLAKGFEKLYNKLI